MTNKKDPNGYRTEPNRFKAMIEDDQIFLGFLTVLYGDISQLREYDHLKKFIRKGEGKYNENNNSIYYF